MRERMHAAERSRERENDLLSHPSRFVASLDFDDFDAIVLVLTNINISLVFFCFLLFHFKICLLYSFDFTCSNRLYVRSKSTGHHLN